MLKNASLISADGIRIYETHVSTTPFSFGRSVFINPLQHTEEELAEIIKHEFVHVKQAHTIDVIWGEFLCIINWYNPFVWLIRNAIRQNLEFIADNKVLQEGIDKREYQYLLLKVIGNKHYSIAHSFNISSLKKRIAMMNKSKSAQLQLMRFLFILPVVAIMLLVFRKDSNAQKNVTGAKKSDTIVVEDTVDPATIKEVTLVPLPPGLINYQKDVKDVSVKGNIVTVFLQNGKKEQYDLNNKKQKEALEKKYGKMPDAPVFVDTISPIQVREVILEPRSSTQSKDAEVEKYFRQVLQKQIALIQESNKKNKENKQKPTVPSKPAPPAKASKVSSLSSPAKVSKESPLFMDGESSFSMNGSDGNGISYVEPMKGKKGIIINKAIVTAESISIKSKDRSLNLQGEASFKNEDGVAMYATTIQLRLKELSSIPYILLNNKELEWDRDYSSNEKQRYEISYLKKEEALQKYGEKGKEGALEITSL